VSSNKETFGQRVTRLRMARGLSASALARGVGYTPTAIWNWENDNTRPRYMTLRKLAEILGVSMEYLDTGSTDDKQVASPHNESQSTANRSVAEIMEDARRHIAQASGLPISRVQLNVQFT
jgi:transcriptional regulator with XRE-family HTH domain